jgi:hypothetical protein
MARSVVWSSLRQGFPDGDDGVMGLELRPTCEHCATSLPADSSEAMICSYECTFCATCVEDVLAGVGPNCGGNFVARPIRPAVAWRPGVSLADDPPGTRVVHKPVDPTDHRAFVERVIQG